MAVTLAQPQGRTGVPPSAPLPPLMEKFVIEGGVPLSGTVVPAGNKNAALPLLAACLLTDEEVVLHNVPRIRDTEALLVLLEDLGVRITRNGGNTLVLCADDVRKTEVEIDQLGQGDRAGTSDRTGTLGGTGYTGGMTGTTGGTAGGLASKAAGLGQEALGNAKQALGGLTGSESLQRDGLQQERAGEAKQGKRTD